VNSTIARIISRVIARWVAASLISFCVTFFGTILAAVIFPDILDTTARFLLLRFLFCHALLTVLTFVSMRFWLR